jgi:hypothetical protein
MRDLSYSPPGSSKRYGRSLVLTPWAGALVPDGLALADGTIRGSSSRFLVEFPLEHYELYAHNSCSSNVQDFPKGTNKRDQVVSVLL